MKSLSACFVVLALAACGSNSNNGSTGTSGGNGSSTGARSTGTGTNSGTGTTTGSATGAAAGTTGTPLGQACTFDATTGEDSCTDEGYECTGELTNSATGTCVLPEEYGICDEDPNMDVGCQDGGTPNGEDGGDTGTLFCSPADFGNMISICIFSCNTTADCPGLEQSCYSELNNGCFNNQCGQDATGTFVGPYFGTCPVLGAADGQCLEFTAGTDTYADCFQNGTAALGQPCNPVFRVGAFSECGYSSFCVPNGGGDGGLCFPITLDGGNCGADDDLITVEQNADWAVCAQDCTTSMACDGGAPAGTTCKTPTGATISVCLP